MHFNLGHYRDKVLARLERWNSINFSDRLWGRDPTLWFSGPVPELTDRLGWLTLGRSMHPQLADIIDCAQQIRDEGATDVVLVGMGGSSLAPRVFQETFGDLPGYPSLTVLDSTHPAAVREVRRRIDPNNTMFIVSSKSGTTLETLSLYKFFWNEMRAAGSERGRHFIAITDHGTPLAKLAAGRGFRRVFEATPDIGGRYSALTAFGLVPAATIGIDVVTLLNNAFNGQEGDVTDDKAGHPRGLFLGAALGELATSGRDKVTLLASDSLRSFPYWIEQLIAESTGKDGKGIVPIIDEPLLPPSSYPPDRLFIGISTQGEERKIEHRLKQLDEAGQPTIGIGVADKMELGRQMLDWEIAVASAATVLGIHPFNQPDVQMTKDLARDMMSAGTREGIPKDVRTISIGDPGALRESLKAWSSLVRKGDYISIQAYLLPSAEMTRGLQQAREEILHRLDVATSLGYGPGFLHSTGQLHKGGPDTGLFLQLVDDIEEDLDVPETDYTFGDLIRASSLGDYAALNRLGREVLRIDLGGDVPEALLKLEAAIDDMAGPRIDIVE